MRAGRLRHFVRIEKPTLAQNSFGEETTTWTLVTERSASVEPISGREYVQAAQVQAEVTHRIRMRYVAGLDTSMRIVHRGRALNIERIIDIDERQIELEIMAKEVA